MTIGGELAEAAGAVNVLYQALLGSGPDNQVLTQGNFAGGLPETDDLFGDVLTVGDFDGDGTDDLVIAVTGEDFFGDVDIGHAHVLHGLAEIGFGDLNPRVNLFPTIPEDDDRYGVGLAAGRLGSGSTDDLAVGVPGHDFDAQFNFDTGVVMTYQSRIFSDGFESGNTSQWSAGSP